MSLVQAALYARVSSEQQATAQTIASHVAALRAQATLDGVLLLAEDEYLDAGYSGATLIRPALERVRDRAAAGGLDRLYVHSPDRLARKYAYQALLVDELQRAGVELVFLNHSITRSARARRMTCSCRCRGWSLSTNAPRSSNAVVAASAMRPSRGA